MCVLGGGGVIAITKLELSRTHTLCAALGSVVRTSYISIKAR